MKFSDLRKIICEAEIELSNEGDRAYTPNGKQVPLNKMDATSKNVAAIKQAITAAKLWDQFKRFDTKSIDVKPTAKGIYKFWVTADNGQLYVYDATMKKLSKASPESIEQNKAEEVAKKQSVLDAANRKDPIIRRQVASCKTKGK